MASITRVTKNVADLTEGEIIGESILSESGQVLIYSETIVTKLLIKKLLHWGIREVVIVKEGQVDVDKPSEQKAAVQSFNSNYQTATAQLEQIFNVVRDKNRLPMEELREVAKQILLLAMTNIGMLERLALIPRAPTFVYGHTVNVGILSVVLGRWIGCTHEQLRALALGSVLHDIGRSFLPPDLLHKYYRLADDERSAIEAHCVRGYRLIESTKYIDPAVKYIVLQHHERMNSSGYPCKLKGEQIHPLARIVGFIDRYDLLTFERGLAKRMAPYQVIEKLNEERFGKFCPVTADTFLRRCNDLLLGGTVQLSDGTMGRVVYANPQNPTRPVLQVGPDFFIDLSEETGLYIESVMSEFIDVVKPIGAYSTDDITEEKTG